MNRSFIFPDGATPLEDYSYLTPKWILSLDDLNKAEAENIAKAQRKFLFGSVQALDKWMQVKGLQKIHFEMFHDVWEWAGKYRKTATSIGIEAYKISSALAEFCHETSEWLKMPVDLSPIERAARIHHRLVQIHPFENGNGRFSRLVADRYLLFWGGVVPTWPNNLHNQNQERSCYIRSLKNADLGDYNPLIVFMKKWGALDPPITKLLAEKRFRRILSEEAIAALVRAMMRREGLQKLDITALNIVEKHQLEVLKEFF